MKKIVLVGAGGLAAEIVETIHGINTHVAENKYEIEGYVVEEKYYQEGMSQIGYPVLGKIDWLVEHKDEYFAVCAVGIPTERARIQQYLLSKGVKFETIISAGVYVSDTTTVGNGVYIAYGAYVSALCKLEDGVIINGDTIIGHDVSIGAYSCVMTRASIGGRCVIGKETMVGACSYIVPDRKVGDKATVAAGSVVFRNVSNGATVLGNPAKRMRALEV